MGGECRADRRDELAQARVDVAEVVHRLLAARAVEKVPLDLLTLHLGELIADVGGQASAVPLARLVGSCVDVLGEVGRGECLASPEGECRRGVGRQVHDRGNLGG